MILHNNKNMEQYTINEIKKAAEANKSSLASTIKELQARGYRENLVPNYDHFYYGLNKTELYPSDIFFDEVVRFEDSSDPEGQSVLYAISSPTKNIKGIYIESYGFYHDELSSSMIERMKCCHDLKRGTLDYEKK